MTKNDSEYSAVTGANQEYKPYENMPSSYASPAHIKNKSSLKSSSKLSRQNSLPENNSA